MIALRNFTNDDAAILQQYRYQSMSLEEIKEMISDWNKKEYKSRYFEMFAVMNEQTVIGCISLYQHSENVISCGPEIFACYRKQGYGKEAMSLALEMAKRKGYKIVSQQIRTNNIASIALHQSLGFETDGYVYINKKGNDVVIYLKLLT